MTSSRPVLTAEWRDLVFLNYEVPAHVLAPLVPAGTTLDRYDGRLLASVVGFRFLYTEIRGWSIPGYDAFEEVNLRFYVRRQATPTESRRAVVFVRELVPRRAVAWIARKLYNEPYLRVPMGHRIDSLAVTRAPTAVHYFWRYQGDDYRIGGGLSGEPRPPDRPSEAEFITEHYWGYTCQRDGGTLEYQVAHRPWAVADLVPGRFVGDLAALYGPAWAEVLAGPPHSAFYADGSAVEVFSGRRL